MLSGAALEGAGMILRPAPILRDKSNILRPPPFGTLCPRGGAAHGRRQYGQKSRLFHSPRCHAGKRQRLCPGEHPTAPSRYVTWACCDDEHGQRQYEWGHYGDDFAAMEQDFNRRLVEYQMQFKVRVVQVEAPGLYKYYSTQRPVDIGTFPKPTHNAPDEIVNYEQRVPVEGGAFLAWGHLTYTRPLTDKQVADYELRPAPNVAELCRGSGRLHSISQQMKDAQAQAEADRGPAAPKKDAPDRGAR